jgi:hypothetical protein
MRCLPMIVSLVVGLAPALTFAQGVTVVNASVKVRPGDGPGPDTTAEIRAARNEFEAVQLVVSGPANDVSATAPTLVGPGGATIPPSNVRLSRVAYQNTTIPSNDEGRPVGRWPDPLIPDIDAVANEKRNAFPFDVPSGENRVIWVEVLVPLGQAAGLYQGSVVVSGSGLGTVSIPMTLLVWDFDLPSTSSLPSTFGTGWNTACVAHYGDYIACGGDAGVERTRVQYARFLLDHRITGDVVYTGPTNCSGTSCDWSHFAETYEALFDGTDPHVRLAGARQTTIRYVWGGSPNQYAAWAKYFRDRKWFNRTFDYTCDEPPIGCDWSSINARAAVVHGADPEFRTLVTANINAANNNGVTDSINILAPLLNRMDDKPGSAFSGNQRANYDGFLQSNPRNLVWWYQSCVSHGCDTVGGSYHSGWPNLMVDASAVQNRSQGILSWLYDVSGVLYFQADLNLPTAWNSVYDYGGNGDGTLLYAGKPSIIGGQTHIPVASIRLIMIREGFEDYEYMKLVSDLGDPAFADQVGRALFPHVYESRASAAALYDARDALAQRILALKGSTPTPRVTMTTPTAGQTLSGTVTLAATASDASGVQFLVDGAPVGMEITAPPYQTEFDTRSVVNGNHAFAARARNSSNVAVTSASAVALIDNATIAGPFTVTSALATSPASPLVNQSTTVTFTVENTSTRVATVQSFVAGVRDPVNANVDAPSSGPVTLQPGHRFTYEGGRSFGTAGSYTAWPAYYDGTTWIELAAATTFTVQPPTPGRITVVTPLSLSPASPYVNQATTATFDVENTGGQPIGVQYFVAGIRDPANTNVDAPSSDPMTLQPGQRFTYRGTRAFATPGTHSAWPAYYDGTSWIELAAPAGFTVQPPTPGRITIVTPLSLSPASPYVNQETTATFEVENTGGQPISVQYFLAGIRDPINANVDAPSSAPVILQPGQRHTYRGTRAFATAGTYRAWPAYYDGSSWIELATPVSFTVQPPTPGRITVVEPLLISPATPFVNQSTSVTFDVENTGGQSITVQYFVAGIRNPTQANVDAPVSASVTLQPGQRYTYHGTRRFTTTGTYDAWPAYYNGTSWIELAPHTSFSVRSSSP